MHVGNFRKSTSIHLSTLSIPTDLGFIVPENLRELLYNGLDDCLKDEATPVFQRVEAAVGDQMEHSHVYGCQTRCFIPAKAIFILSQETHV